MKYTVHYRTKKGASVGRVFRELKEVEECILGLFHRRIEAVAYLEEEGLRSQVARIWKEPRTKTHKWYWWCDTVEV